MKQKINQTLFTLFTALTLAACLTGCGDSSGSAISQSPSERKAHDEKLKDLETKVGFSFPTNTVIVSAGDGEIRDPSSGFYFWGLYSERPISMPVMSAPGVKDYLKLPLESSLKYVQGEMPGRKIRQPQIALGSSWETNGYIFRGTLIRSPQGDYLVIERFRQK